MPPDIDATGPVVELRAVSKSFGENIAVNDVTFSVYPGEVHCLLGDNGAGKSTLVKLLSGALQPDHGKVFIDSEEIVLSNTRMVRSKGVSTVYQHSDTLPLMTASRNFFLGVEPTKGWGPFKRLDMKKANKVAFDQMRAIGLTGARSSRQLVGTMSGGERQALSIARAVYFGARVLVLDEPTSALGVKEARTVLELIGKAARSNVAVVFITHNGQHAMTVADRFTVLIQGSVAATFRRGERTAEEVLNLMAGGEELNALQRRLEMARDHGSADDVP